MRLGVPFIAPRQLGAVGGQQGRLSLPSIGWRTGQSLFMSGVRSPSYSGAYDRCTGGRWLTGQSGAPADSPMNYSRTPPNFPESGMFTGGWPGAPDSPVCQAMSFASLFFSSFVCF